MTILAFEGIVGVVEAILPTIESLLLLVEHRANAEEPLRRYAPETLW